MNDSTGGLGDLVSPLLGTQSCSPRVGVRNVCAACDGSGIVGDERSHCSCPTCDGSGLAYTLEQLIERKGDELRAMRAAHVAGDIERREQLRAQAAHWDDMIAEARRSQEAA